MYKDFIRKRRIDMGKKIIIAGGGHGGITAGMLLAKEGFDVTLYEKKQS